MSARNTLVLLTCIAIAGVFWVLNKFSNTYASTIRVKLTYTNIPADRVIVDPLPEVVHFQVRGTGWELFRYSFHLGLPVINVNIAQYSNQGQIPLQTNAAEMSEQLPYQLDITGVQPKTLDLRLEKRSQKRLPVYPKVTLSVNAQYGITDSLQIAPGEVTVAGPASIVDSMTRVPTVPLQLLDIEEDRRGVLSLAPPPVASIQYDTHQVAYHVGVSPFTDATLKVPVQSVAIDTQRILLLQEQVEVSFQIPMSQYSQLDDPTFADRFQVVADFSKVTTADSLVPIRLERFPAYLRNPKLRQKALQFLYLRP